MQSQNPQPAPPIPQKEKIPHLKDYWKVIMARKWILISTFFIFTICTTVFVFVQTPVYLATCRLEIQPANIDTNEVKAVYDPTLSGIGGEFIRQSFLETQYKLILSDSVVAKTFDHFNLGELPEFKELKDPQEVFRKHLEVEPIQDTWLADVHFEWERPKQASIILKYLVEQFLDEYGRRSKGIDEKTLATREAEVEKLEKEVKDKFDDLQKFIAENGLVSLEDAQKIVRQQYDNLTAALKETILAANEAKSRYDDICSAVAEGRLDKMPEIFKSQTIHDLKLEMINAQLELTGLEERFGSSHPEVLAARKKLAFIEKKIEFEKQCLLDTIKSEYERAENTVKELRADLAEEEKKIALQNTKLGKYNWYKKSYEDAESKCNKLKSDIADLDLAVKVGKKEQNIQVIDEAKTLVKPIRPRKALFIAIASMLGLLTGIGLCFFVEYLDTTIKTKDDVEQMLGTPILGYVPPISRSPAESGKRSSPELSAVDRPHSLLAEAFRSIRTALMFSEVGRDKKNILVTSPTPSEGKTLVSLNIAVALAQSDKKVLLVDADLRKPRLYKILGLPMEPGLSSCLAGHEAIPVEKALLPAGIEDLSFLPSGPQPPNPAELLGSERMKKLMEELGALFDYVVFDTPPTVNATDAATLAQFVGGAVLVVRAFRTERDVALRARDILRSAQVNILGAVLNNADVPRSGYYGYGGSYYYQYYYHPYYSYYSDDKTRTVRKRRRRKSSGGRNDSEKGSGKGNGNGNALKDKHEPERITTT